MGAAIAGRVSATDGGGNSTRTSDEPPPPEYLEASEMPRTKSAFNKQTKFEVG